MITLSTENRSFMSYTAIRSDGFFRLGHRLPDVPPALRILELFLLPRPLISLLG